MSSEHKIIPRWPTLHTLKMHLAESLLFDPISTCSNYVSHLNVRLTWAGIGYLILWIWSPHDFCIRVCHVYNYQLPPFHKRNPLSVVTYRFTDHLRDCNQLALITLPLESKLSQMWYFLKDEMREREGRGKTGLGDVKISAGEFCARNLIPPYTWQ